MTISITALTLLSVPPAVSAASEAQHSKHVVTFFKNHSWLRAPNQPNCKAIPWTKSCRIARRVYVKHVTKLERLERTIPMTSNWTRAMRYAQTPFPGTYGWLEAISGRECRACYTTTAFICNYQGSGACGPMQFMSGTFYGHADDARAYLARRGYIVDPNVWRWDSQLGQALVAGYMRYTGQDGCHWCL